MEIHEFYQKYANLPLLKRETFLGFGFKEFAQYTLSDIYKEIKAIDERMNPEIVRRGQLLYVAEKVFNRFAEQKEL